jgi:hypothetical protein
VDGAVWAVDYVRAHEHLPDRLRRLLAEEGSNVFTGEMLGHVAGDLVSLDGLADEPFLLFFEPPSLDDRIVNQHALFSLNSHPAARLDDWLDAHPALGRKIVVPADLKWELRDKLDQVNVTERVLFPGARRPQPLADAVLHAPKALGGTESGSGIPDSCRCRGYRAASSSSRNGAVSSGS